MKKVEGRKNVALCVKYAFVEEAFVKGGATVVPLRRKVRPCTSQYLSSKDDTLSFGARQYECLAGQLGNPIEMVRGLNVFEGELIWSIRCFV